MTGGLEVKAYIMRGLPGSGKSTYVQERIVARSQGEVVVCSADDYHICNGVYKFDPKVVAESHRYCLRKFMDTIREGKHDVVVDNTNTIAWEISPYYRLAELCEYTPVILWITTPLEICLYRQTHNVPHNTMARMFHQLIESLPVRWNLTLINHLWRMEH